MSVEIGGLNSLMPLYAAGLMSVPLIDLDLMGRAFPEFQMTSIFINNMKGTPASLADEKGNEIIVMKVENDKIKKVEDVMR